jgi:hypothetical protein
VGAARRAAAVSREVEADQKPIKLSAGLIGNFDGSRSNPRGFPILDRMPYVWLYIRDCCRSRLDRFLIGYHFVRSNRPETRKLDRLARIEQGA